MGKIPKWMQAPIFSTLLISILVCMCIIGLRNRGNLEFLELAAYDRYLRWQQGEYSPEPRIVLITISEADIQRMARWPITDHNLAEILKILGELQPIAIGLDIYRDIPVPPGENELSAIFAQNMHIIGVRKIGDDTIPGISPPYALIEDGFVGFNDILVDTDGYVRRGILFLNDGNDTYYSLSLLLSMLYLEARGIVPEHDDRDTEYMRLGKTTFIPFESSDGGYVDADARGYQFLLDFKYTVFKNIPVTDLLSEKVKPLDIKGKIVLIGVTAESVHDYFFTPLSRGKGISQKVFGVELHAHMVSQILRSALKGDRPMETMPDIYEWLLILLLGLAGGAVALFRHSILRFFLIAIGGIVFLGAITYLFFNLGMWFPMVPMALAWFIASALVNAFLSHREKVQKALLMKLFSRHMSADVAEAIWRQRDQFMDDGRPRPQSLTATVLFTDLKGFTTVSEELDPQTLMEWLNEYMEAMAQKVTEHGGVINKYIGDSIMAVFGIPLPRRNRDEIGRDAVNAVDCALTMSAELRRLNGLWVERGLPTTKMRIGIFTGPLVAGSLGSKKRMEYTVIGDTVNIASRLEGLDKGKEDPDLERNACRIFIGEETLGYLDQRMQTIRIGAVTLKGKGKQITIYRVTGSMDTGQKEKITSCKSH